MIGDLSNEGKKIWNQIVAKAWADPQFKSRLLSDPAAVLNEHGLKVTAGHTFKVVENTGNAHYLVLPSPPSTEVSEAELEQIAGGRTSASLYAACMADRR